MKSGSLLKDHPNVLKQSEKYPKINIQGWKKEFELPLTFDGREVWEAYIQFPKEQISSESWAIVSTDILADRYTITTCGQINLFLSYAEIIACIGIIPQKKIDGVLSGQSLEKNSDQGYSIYDAWEYIYENGVSELNCFSNTKLLNKKINLPFELSFEEKTKIYGKKCNKIEGNLSYCLSTQDNNKPIARRLFFSNTILNIKEDTLEKTIESIKYELLRFGPVAGGFLVYENFLNYDGTTVYEKVEGKPVGGHYISIIGWDKDFWICRNSYGPNWGLLGFFKMKMGIKECMLEDNISCCSPFYFYQYNFNDGLYNNKNVDLTDMKLFNPELYENRQTFNIDPSNFYTKETIKLIREGKIYGDLEPLIKYPSDLPNVNYYWAKDFKNFKFINEENNSNNIKNDNNNNIIYITIIISFICFYIGYKIN